MNLFLNLKSQIIKIAKHNNQGSYKTRERYLESVKRFCRYISKEYATQKFVNIQNKHVQAYLDDMKSRGLSASHIKAELSAIRFFHDMCNGKYTLGNFDTGKRRFGGVPRAWCNKEYERFHNLCTMKGATRIVNMATLARNEGLRLHEAIRIDKATAEIALKTGFLRIKGKGGKVREVPLSINSKEMLLHLIKDKRKGEKLFINNDEKTHLVIKQVQNFINRNRNHFQQEGREHNITFHGLRHTYAQEQYTRAIERGSSELEARLYVSNLIGHERDDVTRIYLAKR